MSPLKPPPRPESPHESGGGCALAQTAIVRADDAKRATREQYGALAEFRAALDGVHAEMRSGFAAIRREMSVGFAGASRPRMRSRPDDGEMGPEDTGQREVRELRDKLESVRVELAAKETSKAVAELEAKRASERVRASNRSALVRQVVAGLILFAAALLAGHFGWR